MAAAPAPAFSETRSPRAKSQSLQASRRFGLQNLWARFLMLAQQSLLPHGSKQDGSSSLLPGASTPGSAAGFSLQDNDRHWLPWWKTPLKEGGKPSHVPTPQMSAFLSTVPIAALPPGGVFSALVGTGTTRAHVHAGSWTKGPFCTAWPSSNGCVQPEQAQGQPRGCTAQYL